MGPLKYPDWVIEAEKRIEPFLEGCHLVDGAPEEIRKDFEKVREYFWALEQ